MASTRSSLYYRLSSIDIWNRELAFYSLTLFAILSLVMDCMRLNNYSVLWVVADSIGYLAVFVPLFLFKSAFDGRENRHMKSPWINLMLAAVLGGFHNWVIAWLALELKLETLYDPIFRWVGGALIGLALVVVSATLFTSVQDHKDRVGQLLEASRKLEKYRKSLKGLVEKESAKLQDAARNALIPQLEQIKKLLAKTESSTQAAEALKVLVIDELRPMNTALSRRANSSNLLPQIKAIAGSKAHLPKQANLKQTFAPIGIFGMMLVQQALTLYFFIGPLGLAIGAALSLIPIGLGALLKSLIPSTLKLKTRFAFYAVALLSLISISPILVIDWLLLRKLDAVVPTMITSTVLAILLSGFVGYIRNIQTDQKRIEVELELLNQKLAEQNALFDQQLWIARRQWLTVLHGNVQASLTAAISHLNVAGVDIRERRKLALQDLKRATKALQSSEVSELDLTAAFLDLQSTWQGICKITPVVSEEAQNLVLSNEQTKICINELIKEGVSNAIRHGKAANVFISVEIVRKKVIELRIENDGSPVEDKVELGLGSQLFDDLTLSWSRGVESGRTFVSAHLPVA